MSTSTTQTLGTINRDAERTTKFIRKHAAVPHSVYHAVVAFIARRFGTKPISQTDLRQALGYNSNDKVGPKSSVTMSSILHQIAQHNSFRDLFVKTSDAKSSTGNVNLWRFGLTENAVTLYAKTTPSQPYPKPFIRAEPAISSNADKSHNVALPNGVNLINVQTEKLPAGAYEIVPAQRSVEVPEGAVAVSPEKAALLIQDLIKKNLQLTSENNDMATAVTRLNRENKDLEKKANTRGTVLLPAEFANLVR